jgi:hypothetical protein
MRLSASAAKEAWAKRQRQAAIHRVSKPRTDWMGTPVAL